MIYLYEEAIIEDLREQLGDNRISILPPDQLFSSIANIAKDKVKLPIISLSRIGYSFVEPPHKTPASSSGFSYQIPTEDGSVKFAQVQSIPIICKWQLDIICRTRKDNDNLSREILFYYINNPSLKVVIPYGLNKEHVFSIMIGQDVDDNSDIESHVSRGEYFRTTLTVTCDDAYIWKVTSNTPKTIDLNYHIKENDGGISDYTEIKIPSDPLGEGE